MKYAKTTVKLLVVLTAFLMLSSCYTQFSPPPGERSASQRDYPQPDEQYADDGYAEDEEYSDEKYDEEYYDEGDIASVEGNGYYFYDNTEMTMYDDYDGYDRSPYYVPDINLTIWHNDYYPYSYRHRRPYYRVSSYYSPYFYDYLYCTWDPYWDPWYITSCPPYYSGYYNPYYYGSYGYHYYPTYGHRYGSYGHSYRHRDSYVSKRRDWDRRGVASSGSSRSTNRTPGAVIGSGSGRTGYNPVVSTDRNRPVRTSAGGTRVDKNPRAGSAIDDPETSNGRKIRKRSGSDTGKKQPRKRYRRSNRNGSGNSGRTVRNNNEPSKDRNGSVRSSSGSSRSSNNSGSVRSSGSSRKSSSARRSSSSGGSKKSSSVRSSRSSSKSSGNSRGSSVRSSRSSSSKSSGSSRSTKSSSSGKKKSSSSSKRNR